MIDYHIESNTFSFFLEELETFDVDTDVNGAALLPNGRLAVTVSEDTWIDGLAVRPSEIVEIDPVTGEARILLSLDDRSVGTIDLDAIAYAPSACDDGLDGDGDGLVDAEDPGCEGPEDDSERDPEAPCDDGRDNDGDGLVDHAPSGGDPGCLLPTSETESPACQDGIDNDGDGRVDFDGGKSWLAPGALPTHSPDPHCTGMPWRQAEASDCGLGFEVALVLLPLLAVRERRRRRA